MRVNKMIAAATLPAMMASPVAAAADNPAAALSLRGESGDSATAVDGQANPAIPAVPAEAAGAAGGISTALLIGGVLVVAVVVGALALGGGHHDSTPASA